MENVYFDVEVIPNKYRPQLGKFVYRDTDKHAFCITNDFCITDDTTSLYGKYLIPHDIQTYILDAVEADTFFMKDGILEHQPQGLTVVYPFTYGESFYYQGDIISIYVGSCLYDPTTLQLVGFLKKGIFIPNVSSS